MHITFTSLAFNQTQYFVRLCQSLEKEGYTTSIISFHEDSVEYILKNKIECFNVFEIIKKCPASNPEPAFSNILKKYNIDNPNILLSHEKVAFNLRNTSLLKIKFLNYFYALDSIFLDLKSRFGDSVILFQELGGFASVITSFYVARSFNYDNIFLEPSFFKGRMFFVRNTFESFKVTQNNSSLVIDEVTAYLKNATNNKSIVIPKKDISHYRHPFKKIITPYNIKRLIQKFISKYFLNKQEEFNHIGNYVFRHVRMLANRFLFIRYYQEIPTNKFIYYPFHVPNDVALTVRAPLFVDQYYLIDFISRCIPNNYTLAIKEHPAMIGMVEYQRIKDLLSKNDNIVFLRPEINNHEIMKAMDLLVTVNSKTGAESLMHGKKVICLGDAFYQKSTCVKYLENISNLSEAITNELTKTVTVNTDIINFFNSVYNETYKGELYDISSDNISTCINSIKIFLLKNKATQSLMAIKN